MIRGESFDKYSAARRNVTKDLFKHIDQAVKRDLNVNAELIGKGGEGKSIIGIGLGVEIRNAQRKYGKYEDSEQIYRFDFDQSQKAIKNWPYGTVIIQDEHNELVGEMKNTTITAFNNLIRSFRETNMCYILNNIDYVYIKGLHFVLETYGFYDKYFQDTEDLENMISLVWVRYVDDSHPAKEIYLGMAKIKVYKYLGEYKKYLKYKRKNLLDIKDQGGRRSARFTKKERKEYAEILLTEAQKHNWNGNKSKLDNYFQDAKISLSTAQKKMVITEAIKMYRHSFMKRKANYLERIDLGDPTASFFENYYIEYLDKEKLKDFKLLLKDLEVVPRVCALWVLGVSQEDIAASVHKKPNFVNSLIKTFREGYEIPREYSFGFVFERFAAERFDISIDGRIDHPDFFVDQDEKIIGSGEVKIYDKYRNSITLYLDGGKDKKRSLRPSYNFCKSNNIRFFPVFLRMNKWLDNKSNIVHNYIIPVDIQGQYTFPIHRYDCHERYQIENQFKIAEFFEQSYQESLIGNAANSLDD